jgi:hypothetical protein
VERARCIERAAVMTDGQRQIRSVAETATLPCSLK